jgi:Tfp pilus assembly protein PilV
MRFILSRTIANRKTARGGFTLVEGLMASVILAAAVIGIAGSLGASYKQNAIAEDSGVGLDLARELMEEVAAKPFDPPTATNAAGYPTVTDRKLYDTIDDYNGYHDSSDSIPMWNGSTVDAGNGGVFTRSVSVQQNARPTGLTGNISDFAMVTVTVTAPSGQVYSLSQLCTRVTVVR